MSDKIIHIAFTHCCSDPFIAVRLSDRAFVHNCEVKSALIFKASHSDKWYEVPHGIKIYTFISAMFTDFRCVKLAKDVSLPVEAGDEREAIVGMLPKFAKVKKLTQCQRQ